jgi:DNA polymerase (family 10)
MENKAISEIIGLLADLKELYGEDPFRVSGVRNAARKISKMPLNLSELNLVQLQEIEGIGKSMAKTITEINETGKVKELESLKEKTPPGIIQILDIPGIGPKKVNIIWKELGIESIGELRYACNENRLIEAKGFGIKTQNEILKNLDYFEENEGFFLYPKLRKLGLAWEERLKTLPYFKRSGIMGDLRRKMEFSDRIEILVGLEGEPSDFFSSPDMLPHPIKQWLEEENSKPESLDPNASPEMGRSLPAFPGIEIKVILFQGIPLYLYLVKESYYAYFEFLITGSEGYIKSLPLKPVQSIPELKTEEEVFTYFGLEYTPPEMRENWEEIFRELKGNEPNIGENPLKAYYPVQPKNLIQISDLKGALHNHSTYSDGMNTLEEMVDECQKMGLEYFGICDHSKTAFYANGLSIERVLEQGREIDKMNSKYTHFKIFKGIESDILHDGNLDYPPEILQSFDFIVASVHSNLKMDKEKAMNRLLTAIENPYTTILGHPTGRLLLGRAGYPLDMEIIMEACIKNQVVIEINANPNRLDIDWRWIHYGMDRGAKFSINPDAHKIQGLSDMEYGLGVARKAGLNPESCLNAMSLSEIDAYFSQRKKTRM